MVSLASDEFAVSGEQWALVQDGPVSQWARHSDLAVATAARSGPVSTLCLGKVLLLTT